MCVRTVGAMVGKGISDFVTDWDKVSATVSDICFILVLVCYSF